MREPQDRMRYDDQLFDSRAKPEEVFRDGHPGAIASAIVAAALHAPEPGWVEVAALELGESESRDVREATAIALAHLARRFRRLEDLERVAVVLARLEMDPESVGRVHDVRDDFETFLGNRYPGVDRP
jgi:hypothetical protein